MLLKILLTDRKVREKIIALNGEMAFGKKRRAEMSKEKAKLKRPVENTLRRIALYRGYWSGAAMALRRLEKEDEKNGQTGSAI